MKKMKLLVILILFITSQKPSENDRESNLVKKQYCKIEFEHLGLKDFELGTSKESIFNRLSSLKRINKNIASVENYVTEESCILFGKERKVEYNFSFKNDSLISYLFEFQGTPKLFKELVVLSKKFKANGFIDNNSKKMKYNYFLRSDSCFKFFNLKRYDNDIIISGGVRNRLK